MLARRVLLTPLVLLYAAPGCGGGSTPDPRPVDLPVVSGWPSELQVVPVEIDREYRVTFTRADGAPAAVTVVIERTKLGGSATADEGWRLDEREVGVAVVNFVPRGPIDVVARLSYDVCPLEGERGEDGAELLCAHAVLPGVIFLASGGATATVRPDLASLALAVDEQRPVSALTLTTDGNRSGSPVELASGDPAVLRVDDAAHVTGVAVGTTTLTFTSGTISETIPVTVTTDALARPRTLETPAAAVLPELRGADADALRQGRVALDADGYPRLLVEERVADDLDLILFAWTGTGWGSERLNETWRDLEALRYELGSDGTELLLVRWAHGAPPDEHDDPSAPFLLVRAPGAERFEYVRLPRWPGPPVAGAEGAPPATRSVPRPIDDAADVLVSDGRLFVATVAWSGSRRVIRVSEISSAGVEVTDVVDEEPCGPTGCPVGDVPRPGRLALGLPAAPGGPPALIVDTTLHASVAGAPVIVPASDPAFFTTAGAPLLALEQVPDACVVRARGAFTPCASRQGAPADAPIFVDAGRDALVSFGGVTFHRTSVLGGRVATDDLAPRLTTLELATTGAPFETSATVEESWLTARLRGAAARRGLLVFAVERDGNLHVGVTEHGATPAFDAPDPGARPFTVDAEDAPAGPVAELGDGTRLALVQAADGDRIVRTTADGSFEVIAEPATVATASAAGPDGLYVVAPFAGGVEIVRYAAADGLPELRGTIGLAPEDRIDRLVIGPDGQLVAGGPSGLFFAAAGGPEVVLATLGVVTTGLDLAIDATGFTAVVAQPSDLAGTGTRVLHYDPLGTLVDEVTTAPVLYLAGGVRLAGGIDLWPALGTGIDTRLVRSATTFRDSTEVVLGYSRGAARVALAPDGNPVVVFAPRTGWRDVRLVMRASTDGGLTFGAVRFVQDHLGRLQDVTALASTPTGVIASIRASASLSSDGTGDGAPPPFVDASTAPFAVPIVP